MSVGAAAQATLSTRITKRLRSGVVPGVKELRLRLFFLSEGFDSATADQDFKAALDSLWGRMKLRSPFLEILNPLMGIYYHRETLAGATAAGQEVLSDGSLGELTLDPVALDVLLQAIEFKTSGQSIYHAVSPLPSSALPTILFVYLPEPLDRPAKARVLYPGNPILHSDPFSTPVDYRIVLLEQSDQDHIAVLRVIGEAMGLSLEFEVDAAAPNASSWTAPFDLTEAYENLGPNLVYIPPTGVADALYNQGLDLLTRTQQMVTNLPLQLQIGAEDFIESLYEGGGGYAQEVFRTADDCIMRRRFSSEYYSAPPDPLDYQSSSYDLGFCPACRTHLKYKLLQRPFNKHRFNRQEHRYEQIVWSNGRKGQSFADAFANDPLDQKVFGHPTNGLDHFWSFEVAVDPAKGLVFSDLRDLRPFHNINREIADRLEFRDFQVKIQRPNGTVTQKTKFDLTNPVSLETFYGESGTLNCDRLWHHGFLLRAVVDVDNLVRVTVEQSVCFRAGSNDFDPTKAVVALKVFPELCFSYEPLVDGASVESFHGTVWQHIRPKAPQMAHGAHTDQMGSATAAQQDSIFSTWFAEADLMASPPDVLSGKSIMQRTRLGLLKSSELAAPWAAGAPITFYVGLFHYWTRQESARPTHDADGNRFDEIDIPDEQDTEMEIVGVRLPHQHRASDKHIFEWPAGYNVYLSRVKREGEYDNTHTHGWMGMADNPNGETPAVIAPRRMAPVCGEACIHIHWRWLEFAWLGNRMVTWDIKLNNSAAEYYHGWGDDPLSATSHQDMGAPLVPPNQRVRIAITDPLTKRVGIDPEDSENEPDDSNDVELSTILPGTNDTHGVRIGKLVDLESRALWYDVDIVDHIAPGTKHVICEHGWGYAADHAEKDLDNNVPWEPETIRQLRVTAKEFGYNNQVDHNNQPTKTASSHVNDHFHEVMMFVYDCWQYRTDGEEQIPPGDHPDQAGQITMEKF